MEVTEVIDFAQAMALLALTSAGCVLLVFLTLKNLNLLPRAIIAALPSAIVADGAQIAFLAYEYGNVDITAFLPSTLALMGLSFLFAWFFSYLLDRAVHHSNP